MKNLLRSRLHPVLSAVSQTLMDKILEAAESVKQSDFGTVCRFAGVEEAWTVGPRTTDIDTRTPGELKQLLELCTHLIYGETGTLRQIWLHDGFRGTLHAVGKDITPEGVEYTEDICAPIDVGFTHFYYFHPETGELLYMDEGDSEPVETQDVAEAYLRRVCRVLDLV